MKARFPMHWMFAAVSAVAVAAMLAVALSGCDKKPEVPAAALSPVPSTAPAALPTPAEEEAAKLDADARRQQFFGDGKSHYTPQDVKGF